jgi:uncharacterized phage protein gp47/JayE
MADYIYIEETGVVVPDTSTLLTDVQAEYQLAFGNDLVTTPDTPQGVLINAEALARAVVVNNNAALANQINPQIAGGIFLDAICALFLISRTSPQHSFVVCNLTGVPGTVIPQGSQARDSVYENLWQSTQDVTLASDGTGSVTFEAVDAGALAANSGTITQIVSSVLGWETITNPVGATLGAAPQTDQQLRIYRNNTLALQGQGLAEAVISRLIGVAGVNSLTFLENTQDITQVIDGVTMVPHSLYVCVDGSTDESVATTLTNVKGGGCNYNNGASGNPISFPYTNPFSGQTINVLFDRPDIIEILVRVTAQQNTSVQDPTAAIVQAILDYKNGLIEGEEGLVVGQSVSPFELSGAINKESPGIFVQKVEISLVSPLDYTTNVITIEKWQKADIQATSITVILS